MKWQRRQSILAGFALIALTNAVALGGAVYNRSGPPESTLQLTEREFTVPYSWTGSRENSGLKLKLEWRVLPPDRGKQDLYPGYYHGGSAVWLDAPKMASLGFDVSLPEPGRDARASRDRRQLPREVLLVLELDGPAYQEALERVTRAAGEQEAKAEREEDRKRIQQTLLYETRHASRLFAVDVGLDLTELRNKYPDRSRYAIVRGQVRLDRYADTGPAGRIVQLNIDEILVPMEMRAALEGVRYRPLSGARNETDKGFDAQVAFGKRLEPWLVSVTPLPVRTQ